MQFIDATNCCWEGGGGGGCAWIAVHMHAQISLNE